MSAGVPPPIVEGSHRPEEMVNHGIDMFTPYMNKAREQGWYDRISGLGGKEIGEAQNSKGLWYKQHLDYGPGGRELAYLAGGIRKKFRNIPGTETLAGATEWVKTTGKDKQGWKAFKADITGNGDYPDGLPEILITDGKGRLKVVNGYALKSNDFPWRAAYYDTTTAEERDNLNFSEWKRRATRIEPGLNKGQYAYTVNLGDAGVVRPDITPRQYFRKAIFAPTYKLFKEEVDTLGWNAMDKARLSSAIFKAAYENLIVKPTLVKDFGKSPEEVKTMPQPVYKKIMGMKRVKEAIDRRVKSLVNSSALVNQLFYMVAYQIIKQLYNFAKIEVNPNKPIFNTTVKEIVKFRNQSELLGGIGSISKKSGGKIDEWRQAVEKGYTDLYDNKLKQRNDKRTARQQAHDLYKATKFAHGSDFDRSAAAWNQFTGLEQPEGVGDYMYQEGAPLDIPAPEPEISPEDILAAKINEFYRAFGAPRSEVLTDELSFFIRDRVPGQEISYYGTEEFIIAFKEWRMKTLKAIYEMVISQGEVIVSPKNKEKYKSRIISYYLTNLDTPINPETILALIKYIDQERPSAAKVTEPKFREGFLRYKG